MVNKILLVLAASIGINVQADTLECHFMPDTHNTHPSFRVNGVAHESLNGNIEFVTNDHKTLILNLNNCFVMVKN